MLARRHWAAEAERESKEAARFLPQKSPLVSTTYPSGDFSVGWSRSPKPSGERYSGHTVHREGFATWVNLKGCQPELESDPDLLELYDAAVAAEEANSPLTERYWQRFQELLETRPSLLQKLSEEYDEATAPPLGLSVVTNSPKFLDLSEYRAKKKAEAARRARRGSSGLTRYGKRMIRSMVTLLEEENKRWDMCFGTLTVPPLRPELYQRLREKWPAIVKHFFKELGRRMERQGLPVRWTYVTEIQEKRYENTGEVVPHLHYVAAGRRDKHSPWVLPKEEAPRFWANILSLHLGETIATPWATRVEVPKGTCHKEMAKYLSKGMKIAAKLDSNGDRDKLPSAYWGGALELRRDVKERINRSFVLSGEIVDHLRELANANFIKYRLIYRSEYDLTTGRGHRIFVGVVGYWLNKRVMNACLRSDSLTPALRAIPPPTPKGRGTGKGTEAMPEVWRSA